MNQSNENFPIELAEESVKHFLKTRAYLGLPEGIPDEFQKKAGVFVTIRKNGELRGCIGTIFPKTPSIAREIIINAVSAATQDPRFPPVEQEELPGLTFSADILGTPEPVASFQELNPKIHGIIVNAGNKSGLLLPDIQGIDTVEHQIEIACQKAGIQSGEKINVRKFTVRRYGKK